MLIFYRQKRTKEVEVCSANTLEERNLTVRKKLAASKKKEWQVEFPGKKGRWAKGAKRDRNGHPRKIVPCG